MRLKHKSYLKKTTRQLQQGYRVNQYRIKAVDSFEKGQSRTAYADIQQLRKVHRDKPKPLAKSLRYVAKRISDPTLQSALRQAANELPQASRPHMASRNSKKQIQAIFDKLEKLLCSTQQSIEEEEAKAQVGHYQAASDKSKQALLLEPHHIQTLNSDASALANAGLPQAAFEKFEHSLRLDPQNYRTLTRYGHALAEAGRSLEAFEKFERSLELNPQEPITRASYGKALADIGHFESAFEQLEQALELEPQNIFILNCYGCALAKKKRYKAAFEKFEEALQLKPHDLITLIHYGRALTSKKRYADAFKRFKEALRLNSENTFALKSYGTALAKAKQYQEAFKKFEKALQLNPQNSFVLKSYGSALAKAKRYKEAFEKFEEALRLNPKNTFALNSYARALVRAKAYQSAFEKFEQSFQLNPNDAIMLASYARALANGGHFEQACQLFERSLQLNPDHTVTLNSYGTALANAGRYQEAFMQFEHSLQVKPHDTVTLNSYGSTLANAGHFEDAFEKFKRSLQVKPDNVITLNSYGTALANVGRYQEACEMFERSLQVKSDNHITLFLYATALEKVGDYDSAIARLEEIELAKAKLPADYVNFLYLTLGRLYYVTKSETLGDQYFERAIQNSTDKERSLLYSAKSILATAPYSEAAIEHLKQITKKSPRYAQALKMLTLNLGLEAYYEQFNSSSSAQELKDTEALSRAIYHKMLNEINLFKVILYEIALEYPAEDSTLSDVINKVEHVQAEIRKKRNLGQNKITAIPSHDYQAMIDIISATAHDIADFVNNELFGIKSDIQFMQEDLVPDDAISQQLTEVLEQIERTEGALNDLKSIHEGIQIRTSRFKVKSLFESWQDLSNLGHATIVLHIHNGESQFEGDQHKIRGFLNELIENSLKHNPEQADLRITIESRDVVNPVIQSRTIPGKRKYLRIAFSDNGKGIPKEQKEWIFLPLKSTSPQGSGLGLFIIMKTLEKMGGHIHETGTQGAKFKIYLPYRREEQL